VPYSRTMDFTIRPTESDDWAELRALRLEMLADTPIAFGETLENALRHGEAEWRMRAARGERSDKGILVAAISEDGRWVGTMGAYLPDDGSGPMLVGVYVTPAFRGAENGLTDALLAVVETWARARSSRIALRVHESNARARAAYERHGYEYSGRTFVYVLDPKAVEYEMVKRLE
jgi:GNAT superfamily N-acetyltransferase